MINVSTGEFFGPFDLLLDLIKKSKYDIYDVKLSDITNEYLESLSKIEIPIDETADFILIATQLLYIKTRSLIKDTFEIEEDQDLVSEDELLMRLVEYKKIKSVIPKFHALEILGQKKLVKFQEDLTQFKKDRIEIVYNIERLALVLDELINTILNEEEFKVDKVLNIDEYSLERYSQEIKIKLIKEKMISISKMLQKVKNKSEAIIIFLSILELSKTKRLNIFQDEDSQEITVKLNEEPLLKLEENDE